MKVVSAKVMAELEARAYQMGFTERDFMENAGRGIADATHEYIEHNQLPHTIWLLCGKGNNAGDAFVAGRYLLEKGYQVIAVQPDELEQCSPLCQQNGRRFIDKKGKIVNQIGPFDPQGVILDGIFGTGFHGEARAPYAPLIAAANASGLPIIAVDIPSGLNGTTGHVEGAVIRASMTLFLGLPKSGFFLEEGWNVVGRLQQVDFGLPSAIVEEAPAEFLLNTQKGMAALLPPLKGTGINTKRAT